MPGRRNNIRAANLPAPELLVRTQGDGGCELILSGEWTLGALLPRLGTLARAMAERPPAALVSWNCLAIATIDSAGAMLLWRAWGRALPTLLSASPEQLGIFSRIADADREDEQGPPRSKFEWLRGVGDGVMQIARHLLDFIELLGRLLQDGAYLLRRPGEIPQREIFANVYKSGVLAMPVTALVGFLIGIVLSYLSALQLRNFGADVYIVNILGLGIIRELGPVLVAVLVAGRSGSAMTAQLGVMRVTEEIDALATMGVSRSLRLVLPKVLALALTMPLLVLWTTAIALIGGMVSAHLQLDIGYGFFFDLLPKVVPVANLWIGLAKGFVFGIVVALVACHFGLRVRPNTESLSANTTSSVVIAITAVILVDAIFAVASRHIGMPF